MVLDGNEKRHGVRSCCDALGVALGATKTSVIETGGKSFGKTGRTVHFAKVETEWYAERVTHSVSGDGAKNHHCAVKTRVLSRVKHWL